MYHCNTAVLRTDEPGSRLVKFVLFFTRCVIQNCVSIRNGKPSRHFSLTVVTVKRLWKKISSCIIVFYFCIIDVTKDENSVDNFLIKRACDNFYHFSSQVLTHTLGRLIFSWFRGMLYWDNAKLQIPNKTCYLSYCSDSTVLLTSLSAPTSFE